MKSITITFEPDGSICVANNGASREQFMLAVMEFAKKHGMVITEVEHGEK